MDNVDKDGRGQIVDMELRGPNGFCFLLHVASSKLISLLSSTKNSCESSWKDDWENYDQPIIENYTICEENFQYFQHFERLPGLAPFKQTKREIQMASPMPMLVCTHKWQRMRGSTIIFNETCLKIKKIVNRKNQNGCLRHTVNECMIAHLILLFTCLALCHLLPWQECCHSQGRLQVPNLLDHKQTNWKPTQIQNRPPLETYLLRCYHIISSTT